MMGDLVLLQEEVNPVMSALLENGLEVTALHNHFFWEEPEFSSCTYTATAKALDLAKRVKPALDLIRGLRLPLRLPLRPPRRQGPPLISSPLTTSLAARAKPSALSTNSPWVATTLPQRHGAAINARMGLNSWALLPEMMTMLKSPATSRCAPLKSTLC